jgi:hypothetical protein
MSTAISRRKKDLAYKGIIRPCMELWPQNHYGAVVRFDQIAFHTNRKRALGLLDSAAVGFALGTSQLQKQCRLPGFTVQLHRNAGGSGAVRLHRVAQGFG